MSLIRNSLAFAFFVAGGPVMAADLPVYDLIQHCEMLGLDRSAAQRQQMYGDCVYYETAAYKDVNKIWSLSPPAAQTECGAMATNDNYGSYMTLRKCLLDYKPPKQATPAQATPVQATPAQAVPDTAAPVKK